MSLSFTLRCSRCNEMIASSGTLISDETAIGIPIANHDLKCWPLSSLSIIETQKSRERERDAEAKSHPDSIKMEKVRK